MSENKNIEEKTTKKYSVGRRTLLKAFAGLPVLGLLGFEVFKKSSYDLNKKNRMVEELGLNKIRIKSSGGLTSTKKEDLIRVGMIGFGHRAKQLSNSLGYMHPSDTELKKANGSLQSFLEQEYLNVALVGICDVFDLHAERGLASARNEVRPGADKNKYPVKRYRCYQEMLDDKNIDAVIIATPDHHHARIVTDAAKAGKHVYCEKSPALIEEELNEMYHAVKSSGITYQLGHQITKNPIYQQAKEIIKKDILGKISLVEATSNRNSARGAWIRHKDENGNLKPGDERSIDWDQWLGNRPKVPFSVDRYYNWTKWFDYNSGMIGQLFTHEYDAVNQLLNIGIPAFVSTSGGIYYWKDNRDMPDLLHCVLEYPNHDLTLLYSASLASSRNRGRVFMGHDASMELGNSITIIPDQESTRYKKHLDEGIINSSEPMVSISPNSGELDAVTSATEKYYTSRGLTTANIDGKQVDITHLHLKEWLNCIRTRETTSVNIERAFDEGIAIIMAQRSYLEKRQVRWDAERRKII